MKNTLKLASACAAMSAAMAATPRAVRFGPQNKGGDIVTAGMEPDEIVAAINTTIKAQRDDIAALAGKFDALDVEKFTKQDEELNNLQNALDKIQAEFRARQSEDDTVQGDLKRNPEYVSAFKGFMRKGEEDGEVRAAMQIGSAPDGGYLAPVEWDRSITAELVEANPFREFAQVITIGGQGFKRLYSTGRPGSGWVGETAARPETTTPQFSELSFDTGEIYANPAITQTALDDAAIDLEAWLRGEVTKEFTRQENIAFLSGNGVNKPYGILGYVENSGTAFENRHPLGAIADAQLSGALGAAPDPDNILDFLYSMPVERITSNTRLFMNRMWEATIRKIKTADGDYLWQPAFTADAPNTILGVPTTHLPGLATAGDADGVVALYGDMRETYLIIDRVGVRVLRDPYTNKPFVMFYTTKRVGGGVQNPEYMIALRNPSAV